MANAIKNRVILIYRVCDCVFSKVSFNFPNVFLAIFIHVMISACNCFSVFAFWRKASIQSLLDHPVNIGKLD